MPDIYIDVVPWNGELTLIPPQVAQGEFYFSRPFSLGGVGTWTLSRPFDIVQAGVTYTFHRSFDIKQVSSPYIPPELVVSTTLAAQASAGTAVIIVTNASGIEPGVALQLNRPHGERARVAAVAGTTVQLANRLLGTYPAGTTVDEANLYIPALSVFDKRGVILGVIETPIIDGVPSQSFNNSGSCTFLIPRNIGDRSLLAPDRIVVIGNSVGLSPWAGVIRAIDWSDGRGQAQCDDLFTAVMNVQNIKIEQELPDNTLATTIASMILTAVNDSLEADGQVKWGLDASGSKVYRGDVDYDEAAASAFDELAERAGIEFTYRVNIVGGRIQPYVVIRDEFRDFWGPMITDERTPRRYRDAVLLKGNLAGYWRLGELTGTVAADELNIANGAYTNSPTLGVAGQLANDINTAVTLNGSSQFVDAGTSTPAPLGAISVSGWFRTSASGTVQRIAHRGSSGDFSWSLYVNNDNRVYFSPLQASGTAHAAVGATPTVTDGRWHFALGTFDGSVVTIYLDGVSSASDASLTSSWGKSAGSLNIGRAGNGSNYFNGSLDEVAVWNRALSPAEALDLFKTSIGAGTEAANLVESPRIMIDPGEKVNAVTLTGIETDVAGLLPDWAQWAVKEVEPKVTIANDLNEVDERRMWDREVSVEWSLSKAQQKQIAEAILDRIWTMYHSFLRAYHDRYGRIFHEGWKYEGPPDSMAKYLTKDKYWSRLELIEAPAVGGGRTAASLVLASSSKAKTNLNRWIVVSFDRLTQKQTVQSFPPSLCLGPLVCKVIVQANGGPEPGRQYRLWRVAGGVYTSSMLITVASQQTWPVDASDHRIGSANVPKVTYKYGGFSTSHRGTYDARANNTKVRYKPYTTARIRKYLNAGSNFIVRQRTTTGTKVNGSRSWYGNYSGDQWVHSSHVKKASSLLTTSKMLRRIQTGTYAGWWLHLADDGYTLQAVRVSSVSGSTATYHNALLNKIYDVERQSIHQWDPRRDGIGQLVSRPTVFFGSRTTRARWHIVPWIGGGGGTQLLAGITSTATTFEVESYMEIGQGAEDFMVTIGEGAAEEDCLVTNFDGNRMTVVRGRNGTTAILHEAGESVQVKEPVEFEGFEIDYDWPEGEAWAADYLAKMSIDKVRHTVTVPATFPTAIGRRHVYRTSTEGPGPTFETQLRATRPTAMWPLKERLGYAAQHQSSDTWAYWPLTDEEGTTVDEVSGNARTGTLTGSYALGASGPFDLTGEGALGLTAGSVTTGVKPAVGTTGHLTVGAWFKTTATGNSMELVRAADASNANGWRLGVGQPGAGRVRWALHTSVTIDSASTQLYNDGRWHFAVGVLDRTLGAAYLYVDGQLVASGSAGSLSATSLTPTANTVLGTNFVGTLGQVFITLRAMSPDQVMTLTSSATRTHYLYSGVFTGGQQIRDESGNGFHGTAELGLVMGSRGPVPWDPLSFGAAAPQAGDGYVIVPHNAAIDPGANSFTLGGWWKFPLGTVNPNASAGKGDPFGTVNPGWSIRHSTTSDPVTPTLTIGYSGGDTSCDAPPTPRGIWTHYAWAVDRAAGWIYPYRNGVLGTPIAITIGSNSIATSHSITMLRAQSLSANGVVMAHFAYWPRALKDTDLAALYDAVASPSNVAVREANVRVLGVGLSELDGTNELLVEEI